MALLRLALERGDTIHSAMDTIIQLLADLNPFISERYDPDNFWWLHEKFHRLILRNFESRMKVIRMERDELGEKFLKKRNAKLGCFWVNIISLIGPFYSATSLKRVPE